MPSTVLGNPLASGPQIVVSGWPWSGNPASPVGGVLFRLSYEASGRVYIGLSGNLTLNSGGMLLSGGGFTDGMVLGPGDDYFIPRLATGLSGNLSVYARHDAACSGQARLHYEIF